MPGFLEMSLVKDREVKAGWHRMLVTEPGDVHGSWDVLAMAQQVSLTGRHILGSRVNPGNWETEWECCCWTEDDGLGKLSHHTA